MAQIQNFWLVDYLVTQVANRALNPQSQNLWSNQDIANMMDSQVKNVILPLLKEVHQEYLVMYVDDVISSMNASYKIPPRAIGNALRDIVLVDASGNEIALNNLLPEYTKLSFPFNNIPPTWSFSQFLKADSINLFNQLVQSYSAYTLRFKVERRPGMLTLSSNCGQITNITGNILTLSYVDSTWTTSYLFDIINNYPPFDSLQDDSVITNINGLQVTFANVPSTVAVGMWVCPQMMSCIPQIPLDLFDLLVECTIQKLAQALDDNLLAQSCEKNIQLMRNQLVQLVKERVKGSPQKVINRDIGYNWSSQSYYR